MLGRTVTRMCSTAPAAPQTPTSPTAPAPSWQRKLGGDSGDRETSTTHRRQSGTQASGGQVSFGKAGGGADEVKRNASTASIDSQSPENVMAQKAKAAAASFKKPSLWVLIFGWSLACCAGFVNTVCMLVFGVFPSHVTGTTSRLGMSIDEALVGDSEAELIGPPVRLLLGFLCGAYMCGLVIDKNQVHLGGESAYGLALIGESALLIISITLQAVGQDSITCVSFVAVACGLQNAMCTNHFGAIVRTTHVTGTLTDIGSILGRMTTIMLRRGCDRRKLNVIECAELGVDTRKVSVLTPMWCSFLFGSFVGSAVAATLGIYALLFPAAFTFSIGSLYVFLRGKFLDKMKEYERKRLTTEVTNMKETMQHASMQMHTLQELQRSNSCVNISRKESRLVIELEEEMEQMHQTFSELQRELSDLVEEHEQYDAEHHDADGCALDIIEEGEEFDADPGVLVAAGTTAAAQPSITDQSSDTAAQRTSVEPTRFERHRPDPTVSGRQRAQSTVTGQQRAELTLLKNQRFHSEPTISAPSPEEVKPILSVAVPPTPPYRRRSVSGGSPPVLSSSVAAAPPPTPPPRE